MAQQRHHCRSVRLKAHAAATMFTAMQRNLLWLICLALGSGVAPPSIDAVLGHKKPHFFTAIGYVYYDYHGEFVTEANTLWEMLRSLSLAKTRIFLMHVHLDLARC
jgi:hypothetical protein